MSGLLTAALLLACWPVWEAAGWLLDLAGLGALGVVGRFAAVVLFLTLAEAAIGRLHAQP